MFRNSTITDLFLFVFTQLILHYLHFTLDHIPNGTYTIKTKFVNEENGSIQNEWKNYHCVSDLSIGELEYFRRICTPKLQYAKVIVTDNKLDFNTFLKPNEIRLIEIINQ